MKKIRVMVIFILIIYALGLFRREFIAEPIVRTAVKRKDIKGNYIICKYVPVTDFEWYVYGTGEELRSKGHCNIIGPVPWDYPFTYEFKMCGNFFVFYVDEQREYYSEETRQDMLEYTVSGWDIVYPVRHEHYIFDYLFKSPKYILESDLRKK